MSATLQSGILRYKSVPDAGRRSEFIVKMNRLSFMPPDPTFALILVFQLVVVGREEGEVVGRVGGGQTLPPIHEGVGIVEEGRGSTPAHLSGHQNKFRVEAVSTPLVVAPPFPTAIST